MIFDLQRLLQAIVASVALVSAVTSLLANEQAKDQSSGSHKSSIQDHGDRDSDFTQLPEPLDLSELLRSLGEILSLEDAPRTTLDSVKLVGADEPIIIGTKDGSEPIETPKPTGLSKPENSLRTGSEKQVKLPENKPLDAKPSEPKPATPPSKAKSTNDPSEPLALTFGDDEDAPKALQAEGKALESKSSEPTPSATPKPKMVEIKPVIIDEQESPQLSNLPREIDRKQANEEDEKAIIAKRPEAEAKTFVRRPSAGRLSSPGGLYVSPTDLNRAKRIESCLSYYLANPELVVERSPWAVMHAMLPFGVEGEILVGNKRVNAIQWMCNNGTCRTQKLFSPAGRYFRPNVGGGVQGHEGQFLAMLAQSQVAANYPIVVGQNKYTVTDLIRYEMATCKEKAELTFKLIGLSYYIDTEQVWLTDKRSRWSIEKLVQEEIAQPINGAACGGTHRLMGLTFAVRQRKAEGRPIDGQFARAERYVDEFVDYAWKLQNPDGSFSTSWFESRANEPVLERKVQTTGHILEWLAFTVSEEELNSPRFKKSIDFLLSQIWDHRRNKWPIGPRGHATRAIALYHQRTTGILPGQRHSQLAEQIQILRMNR